MTSFHGKAREPLKVFLVSFVRFSRTAIPQNAYTQVYLKLSISQKYFKAADFAKVANNK